MAKPLETMTMIDNNKPRPSVLSSSEAPSQGSGKEENRAEGTKNLWVRTGCHWNMRICTYNARSLSSDDRMLEFGDELAKINFDVVGISEVQRKGEGCISLANSGHNLYHIGGNTCHRGVGFVVHKNITGYGTSFKGVSDRLAQLTIEINGKYHMNIIQAYLPTISHTDEEVDIVYEDMDNLITNTKAQFNIIMGDFNAKVGLDEPSKSCTGAFGLGICNSRGDSLIYFAEQHQLEIMNTFFKKSPTMRWTWISPNGTIKNAIDLHPHRQASYCHRRNCYKLV
ncbi:craniofacial development protein 2-like [Montipora capricornis]|uniref:craniofacial development protein 2-like n=1 Tax=Montipora capricornis TaxID=246305 RepID=UPI0035F17EC5